MQLLLIFSAMLMFFAGSCSGPPPEPGIYAGGGWNKLPSLAYGPARTGGADVLAETPKMELQGPTIVLKVYFGREPLLWDSVILAPVQIVDQVDEILRLKREDDPFSGLEILKKPTGEKILQMPASAQVLDPEKITLKAGSKIFLKCVFRNIPQGLYLVKTSATDQQGHYLESCIEVR